LGNSGRGLQIQGQPGLCSKSLSPKILRESEEGKEEGKDRRREEGKK
jgi:hypothetical protein